MKGSDKKETKRDEFFGCYGPKMKTSEVQKFIMTAIQDNWDRENNRFTINVWGLPGCVGKDTLIKVRKISDKNSHKIYVKNGDKIESLTCGNKFSIEFFEREMKISEFFKLVEEEGGTYEIETDNGYKPLGDLVIKKNMEGILVRTEDGDIECSTNHLFMTEKGWKFSDKLSLSNDKIKKRDKFVSIICKEYLGKIDTYDFEVLTEEHSYLANGFVSHNTSKTSCIKQLANKPVEYKGKMYEGIKVIDIPLAQIEEFGQISGLPETFVEMEREIPEK